MITRITINELMHLLHLPVLDVRSPAEYAHAHIPGAFSLPLFTDEERKVVGTLYKQQGKQKAIKAGLDFFGPKMRALVEQADEILKHHFSGTEEKKVIVHCWRGGMRSAGVAWLLDLYGYRVFTIVGGYKAYRRWALQQFEKPHRMNVLGGYTGSGKTAILHRLAKSHAVIDLEAIANHQGSAFGGIGRSGQPGQEMFENALALDLYKAGDNTLWIEDESQRVGNNIIPNALWKTMRSSPVYFIEMPFEERLQRIIADYGSHPEEKLINAIVRIQKRLGPNETKMSINYIVEGNIEQSFRILLSYYDKLYAKSLQNRDDASTHVHKISCNSPEDFFLHEQSPLNIH